MTEPVEEYAPTRIMRRGTADGADCANCPLAVGGEARRPICAEGPERPKWIALGGGPGRMEAMAGRPIAGKGGVLLATAIARSGTAREDVWVTSTILCYAGPEATDAGKRAAARACAPRLLRELAQFPGLPILALGADAARATLGVRIKASAMFGSYHVVTLGSPAARAVAARIDDLDADREKVRGRVARAENAAREAERAHAATCAGAPDDPAHARGCKAAKKVTKAQAKLGQARADLRQVEDARAVLLEEFNAEVARSGDTPREVVPTIHPEAVVMGGSGAAGAHSSDLAAWNLYYDAAKVSALAERQDVIFRDDVAVEWRDPAAAHALIERVAAAARAAGVVAVDCETYVEDPRHSALQSHLAKLRAIGFAVEEFGVSVYWAILREDTRAAIQSLLGDPGVRKVFHNHLYDVPVLRANGYPVEGPIDDTLLMHHAAFPGMSHRLQGVGAQFMAITPWKSEFRDDDDTPETLTEYNAKDTLVTMRMVAPLRFVIDRTKTERAYAMDLRTANIAIEMHERGVPIHKGINKALYNTFAANLTKARQAIEARANDPEILPRLWARLAFEQAQRKRKSDSDDFGERVETRVAELRAAHEKGKWRWSISNSDHVVAYLKARGVPMVIKTKKGKTSTQKIVLENLQHVREVADIINFRENDKLASTFVRPMYAGTKKRAAFVGLDGRIHPTWAIHAITTRWRSHLPGVQNWPKKNKKRARPDLRSQVVAPRGRKFVGFDFAQLEARVIALLSGDKFLIDLFAAGRDIHTEFARIVWEDFDEQDPASRKLLRDMIKRPEYGWLFGGAVQTLWQNVVRDYPKVQLSDIARMVQKMEKAMTGVTRWHNDLVRLAATPPYELRSALYGRRRCFPLGTADVTDLYNWPVQTTGAEIMNTGLVNFVAWLRERYPTAFVILHIHDAAVVECDEADAEAIAAGVETHFSQHVTHEGRTVYFPVDPKIGRTWAKV